MEALGLTQHIGYATHQLGNMLDHIYTESINALEVRHSFDKYQNPHVMVAKLFTIFTRTCSGSYAISWLECRQTNMFDAKTVILY